MDNYVIPAEFYTFSDFIDPCPRRRENGGESGKLLVAERKPGVEDIYPPKLLVKHRYAKDAYNEYMASRLAALIGVPVAKVYLISCTDWRKHGFASRHACGIEYIDGLRYLTDSELHSVRGGLFLAKAWALSALLSQSDKISVGVGDIFGSKRAFYTYDLAETFLNQDYYIAMLLATDEKNIYITDDDIAEMLCMSEFNPHRYLDYDLNKNPVLFKFCPIGAMIITLNNINMEQSLVEPLKWSWSMIRNIVNIVDEYHIEYIWTTLIETVRELCFVDDEAIEDTVSAIRHIYGCDENYNAIAPWNRNTGDVLAWYYKTYIAKIKKLCIELLDYRNFDKLKEIKNYNEKS